MALRSALYAASLAPAVVLAGCGEDTSDTSDTAQSEQAAPGHDDGAMDPGSGGEGAAEPAAESETATAAETARGGDAVTVGGETTRGPAVQAVAERFGLSKADAIILPTLYRATADIISNELQVDRSQGDLGYITVSGSVDRETVLEQPRDGLAFELTADRIGDLLGETVIVTFVARMNEAWEGGDQRPALQAAWVEPNGDTSGWRTMNLTEDWQKTVFVYDRPQDGSGTHILTLAPPRDQPVDIAAVAIRAQGALDTPDPGGDGE